jgi:hypothetical protein
MVVKRFGVGSVAKIYGAISAAFGLLAGCIIALGSLMSLGFADTSDAGVLAPMFGIGAVVFLPIFYGVMGLIAGALGAVLYNVFAGMVGGVRIEVE